MYCQTDTSGVKKETKKKIRESQRGWDEVGSEKKVRRSVSVMLFGNSHLTELNSIRDMKVTDGNNFFPPLAGSVICESLEEMTVARDSLKYFETPSSSQ